MFYIYADGEALYYPLTDDLILLSPKLTVETGKAGSLTFRIPPTNKRYSDLHKLKTVITVELDDLEIFRGRVLTDSSDFNNIKTIYCEGNLAYLVDSEQKGIAYHGTVHDFFTKAVEKHNARVDAEKRFAIGEITVEDRELIIPGKSEDAENLETDQFDYRQIVLDAITTEWKKTYDLLTSCLIDNVGGYLRTRRVGDTTYLDYLQSYEDNATQELAFGVNILDLNKDVSAEDIFSVLIPLGDENLTIESVNNGSDEIVDADAVSLYGRIVRTHVFNTVTDPTTLLENGNRYIANRLNVPFELDVTAVDLSALNPDLQPILVGARVKVKSAPHGVTDTLTAYKIEYDLEKLENTVYSFGTPRQTLTERYRKDKAKAADATENAASSGGGRSSEKAVEEAVESVYREWIDIDPNDPDGHISLGAAYTLANEIKTKMTRDLGLDMNAVEGTINLSALRTDVNESGQKIASQSAQLSILEKGTQSSISLLAGRTDYLENVATTHSAELTVLANDVESIISLKADKITIDTALNGIESNIASFSRQITTINSDITSVRTLIADQITALKANINWLSGLGISCQSISTSAIGCDSIVARNTITIGDSYVATRAWVAENVTPGSNVSWGNVANGFAWLNVEDRSYNLAMAGHTHSQYLTAMPSHKHTFYCTVYLPWNHKHLSSGAGYVSDYSVKTIIVSGSTNNS